MKILIAQIVSWVQGHVVASVAVGVTAVAVVGGGTTAVVASVAASDTQSVVASQTPTSGESGTSDPTNASPTVPAPSTPNAPMPTQSASPVGSSPAPKQSSGSSGAQATGVPYATNVSITPSSMTSFSVSWSAATGASSFGSKYLLVLSGRQDFRSGETWVVSGTSWQSPNGYWSDFNSPVVYAKVGRIQGDSTPMSQAGDWSAAVSQVMPDGIPGAPTNIQYSVDGSLMLTISWSPANPNGGAIDRYVVITGDPAFRHGDGWETGSSPTTGDVSYSATSDIHCFYVYAVSSTGQEGAHSQSYCW